MADADWSAPDAVASPQARLAADLAARPFGFGFYAVMRRLEAAWRDRPRFGRSVRPAQDAVRLAQAASVDFAPSTLAAWEEQPEGRPARLSVRFFGLFGPDGPLPLHLSEYARNRARNERDPTFQRFADLFHHRMLSLFWRAWADARPTVAFDRPEQDRFALYAGALLGLGAATLRDRDAMPDLTKLHFAGHLANQTRHAEGLGRILSAFFVVPVHVESFVGGWLALPPEDVTRLGRTPATGAVGRTALLGARVWSRQHKFRIVFGPLSRADYERLLPGGNSFRKLVPIVRNYVGDTLVWDVNLILRREDVPKTLLGQQGRMGWTTWLGRRPDDSDAADLLLDASADSLSRAVDARIDAPTPEEAP